MTTDPLQDDEETDAETIARVTAEARAASEEIGLDYERMIARRLLLWVIRWIIGFALIWAVTAWTGRFGWLWLAGFIVAILSLMVTLGAQAFVSRRLGKADHRFAETQARAMREMRK